MNVAELYYNCARKRVNAHEKNIIMVNINHSPEFNHDRAIANYRGALRLRHATAAFMRALSAVKKRIFMNE